MQKAIFVVLFTVPFLYLGYMLLDAFMSVKTAPREPMFFCNRHGFMRKEHTITLVEWSKEPQCPVCFSEAMKAASRVPAIRQ